MPEGNVTLVLTLVGGNEHKLDMPLAEAQQIQRDLVEAFEKETVTGSVTFGNGLLVRFAAIAATQIAATRDYGAALASPVGGARMPTRAGARPER